MSYYSTSTFQSRRQRTSSWSRNQNTVAFTSAIKIGPVAHTVLIALMITVLGLIYLTQATKSTSYDYAIQSVDKEIASLNTEKNELEIENARLQALETIKNSNVASAMVEPSEVSYSRP